MPYYANKTTLEGLTDSYQAEEVMPIYSRVRSGTGKSRSGNAQIVFADAVDIPFGILMQPAALGQVVMVSAINSGAVGMGVLATSIAAGALLYGAADGQLTSSSGGGARIAGRALTDGFAGGRVTYTLTQ